MCVCPSFCLSFLLFWRINVFVCISQNISHKQHNRTQQHQSVMNESGHKWSRTTSNNNMCPIYVVPKHDVQNDDLLMPVCRCSKCYGCWTIICQWTRQRSTLTEIFTNFMWVLDSVNVQTAYCIMCSSNFLLRDKVNAKPRLLHVLGMTGPVVIDYDGDRIMDYQVWYLNRNSDKFDRYMKIPLIKTGRNATACMEWLVM